MCIRDSLEVVQVGADLAVAVAGGRGNGFDEAAVELADRVVALVGVAENGSRVPPGDVAVGQDAGVGGVAAR